MLGRGDLEPVVAMVGRHQLQRGLVGRPGSGGSRGDDPSAAQRVEDGHLLLVEQARLDDLGHDDVGSARQIDHRRVALDDADAVRDAG